MLAPFTLPVEVVVALIGGAVTILTLFIKGEADRSSHRIDEMQADVDAIKKLFSPVVAWAFDLEQHILAGSPPPPPPRPPELAQFMTAAFVDRERTDPAYHRGFFFHRNRKVNSDRCTNE